MLKTKAKSLKEYPGVYLMKDKFDIVIYVGKSKNLRNRVSSYFSNIKNRTSKVEKLIKNIADFEYIYLDTEVEALLLEKELIDRYKPTYNRLLKNTKRYPYIEITLEEEYPRILVSYEPTSEYNLYFGPFTSLSVVEKVCFSISKTLKLRTCNRILKSSCLNYNLKNCLGVCTNPNIKEKYYNNLNIAIEYLSLLNTKLLDVFQSEMKKASLTLDFENAIKFREDIKSLNFIRELLLNSVKIKNKNVLMVENLDKNTFKVFCIYNKIFYCEKYNKKDVNITMLERTIRSIFNTFEKNSYDNKKSSIDITLIINRYLNNNKVNFLEITDQSDISLFLNGFIELQKGLE
ncbi:GIY-YIG nuclease family protein [Clostridium senegalense]|uniref:GIY-YIG nuclease family protein n=1 Tax=Clostridium senegalense TaxID=1465809 RepID=UPI00246810F4|nr:GIY-YIG nuclease family protein [Clostridium senegalense]